jgi:hypothetical protein
MPTLLEADSRAMTLIAEMPAATREDVIAASLEADTMARSANASLEADIRSLSLRIRALRLHQPLTRDTGIEKDR